MNKLLFRAAYEFFLGEVWKIIFKGGRSALIMDVPHLPVPGLENDRFLILALGVDLDSVPNSAVVVEKLSEFEKILGFLHY